MIDIQRMGTGQNRIECRNKTKHLFIPTFSLSFRSHVQQLRTKACTRWTGVVSV